MQRFGSSTDPTDIIIEFFTWICFLDNFFWPAYGRVSAMNSTAKILMIINNIFHMRSTSPLTLEIEYYNKFSSDRDRSDKPIRKYLIIKNRSTFIENLLIES